MEEATLYYKVDPDALLAVWKYLEALNTDVSKELMKSIGDSVLIDELPKRGDHDPEALAVDEMV